MARLQLFFKTNEYILMVNSCMALVFAVLIVCLFLKFVLLMTEMILTCFAVAARESVNDNSIWPKNYSFITIRKVFGCIKNI
jgi:hypothetical protein